MFGGPVPVSAQTSSTINKAALTIARGKGDDEAALQQSGGTTHVCVVKAVGGMC